MHIYPGQYRVCIGQLILSFIVLLVVSCGSDSSQSSDSAGLKDSRLYKPYLETGDLATLKDRRLLRVLVPRLVDGNQYLPRSGFPLNLEVELLAQFAIKQDMQAVQVYVDDFSSLIPSLLAGKGDVIAANMTVTKARQTEVAFTEPFNSIREQLVLRHDEKIETLEQLASRRIAVQKSSAYWETAQELQRKVPGLSLQEIPDDAQIDEILHGVADGDYDLSIADSNIINAVLVYQDQLKAGLNVGGKRAIAWAVRPDSANLRTELNKFLIEEKLGKPKRKKYTDDFTEIKQRKVLRVLTRNNAATYFLWRGELMGFDYELTSAFAKQHGMRVEMIVPPSRDLLIPWLIEGKGDMIAASLTIHNIADKQGVVFSRPSNEVSEVVVSRRTEPVIAEMEQLSGRTIAARPSSSYWRTVSGLIADGVSVKLQAVPEEMETEEIIASVAEGDYDLTVADSHIADIDLTWRDDISKGLVLKDNVKHGWLMRESNPDLVAAVNQFLAKEYRGVFYNITRRKYFEKPQAIKKRLAQRVDTPSGAALSPYDDIVKPIADEHNFDWRLITAQMYQESRFNPKAKSLMGAQGLMQVMPRTARELGVSKLEKPENGINAGVRYLAWLRDRFEPELDVAERSWFVLAAYNAGAGHVRDARQLAARQGLSPNHWFGNVEKAMLLLSRSKYAKQALHGFVRGTEPVNYVRQIRNRFQAYVQLTESAISQ